MPSATPLAPSGAVLDIVDHQTHPSTPAPRRHRRRWAAAAGPLLAVTVAGLAVGRFVLAGSSDDANSPGPRVTAPAVAQGPVERATVAVRDAIRTGDPAQYALAEAALAEADRVIPDHPDLLATRAVLALSVHDFAGALPLARRAVEANPYSTAALAALVDAEVENGDYTAGQAALQRLLDVEPGAAAYARVSYFRQLAGDRTGAIIAMRQAVTSSSGPDQAVVLTYLGDLLVEDGDPVGADAAYTTALTAVPGFVGAELGRARVAMARGEFVRAAALLDPLLARTPLPAVAVARGELALLTGDTVTAADAFALVEANDRILRSQGVSTDGEYAAFVADHGDPDVAVELAAIVHVARPTVFTADVRGWALTRAGRADEALPYVAESLSGGITTPAILVHAAAAYAATGDTDRARVLLAQAFEAQPWMTPAIVPVAEQLATALGPELPEGWQR